jgi:large subunit ribosomal protein L25
MSEVLQVESRTLLGKQNNRRLRSGGRLPAVLYGHGKESVHLTLCEDQFNASLRHGAIVVELAGAEQGQALLQDVQWDTFQQSVLHVDLLRVVKGERVTVEIPLIMRGDAPGTHGGGVVEQLLHVIELETVPSLIPENLQISVNELELDCSLTVEAIEGVPEGATLLADASQVCVQCVLPSAAPEVAESEVEGASEPEVVGRQAEDGSSGDSGE